MRYPEQILTIKKTGLSVKEKVFIDCPKGVCQFILVSWFIPCYQKIFKNFASFWFLENT